MALDKERKDMPFLVGRLIAITEHYAGKYFGPGTLTAMYQHPAHGLSVFRRYVDNNDPFLQEIMATEIEIPVTAKNEIEKGQMTLGYYHQKKAYGPDNEQERKRIGQDIAEMRKAQNMTQQQLADLTQIQRNHISRIEAGRYSVGFDTLQTIAAALDADIRIVPRE